MRYHLPLLSIASLLLISCLSLPSPEPLFHSRSVVAEPPPLSEAAQIQIWIPYVGQGDATLVIFPNGKKLLIDAGAPGAAKTYLLPLLEKLGIHTLDAVVLTHYDLDHLGGFPELPLGLDQIADTSDDVKILSVYDRGGTPWDESPGYGKYLLTLESKSIPRYSLSAGDSLALDSSSQVRCLAANGIVGDGTRSPLIVDISPPTYAGRENAASIALLIKVGDFRYLTAGDLTGGGMSDGFLTPDVETSLAQLVGEVDILHVNHHGSLSSSNKAFVEGTRPRMALVQAGENNPYGHPHSTILKAWLESGTEVHVTEEGNNLQLTTQPDGTYTITSE